MNTGTPNLPSHQSVAAASEGNTDIVCLAPWRLLLPHVSRKGMFSVLTHLIMSGTRPIIDADGNTVVHGSFDWEALDHLVSGVLLSKSLKSGAPASEVQNVPGWARTRYLRCGNCSRERSKSRKCERQKTRGAVKRMVSLYQIGEAF